MGRDKCSEESHCRADARRHRGAPQLNSSEGIKYAHGDDKPQLPETKKRGAAQALEKGDPASYVSAGGPLWFKLGCHILTVSRSQEGRVEGQGQAQQHPKGQK